MVALSSPSPLPCGLQNYSQPPSEQGHSSRGRGRVGSRPADTHASLPRPALSWPVVHGPTSLEERVRGGGTGWGVHTERRAPQRMARGGVQAGRAPHWL